MTATNPTIKQVQSYLCAYGIHVIIDVILRDSAPQDSDFAYHLVGGESESGGGRKLLCVCASKEDGKLEEVYELKQVVDGEQTRKMRLLEKERVAVISDHYYTKEQ